jgi:hypothetical protein
MVVTILCSPRSLERNLFHFGLAKILVEAIFQEKNDNWVEFLVRNHFIKAPCNKNSKDRNARVPKLWFLKHSQNFPS